MRTLATLVVGASLLACAAQQNAAPHHVAESATAPSETRPAPSSSMAPARIVGEEVTYTAGDTTLRGYLAYDAAQPAPRPGVLVVHEWWGLTDYVRKRADQLAAMGYVALALDMYGDGKTAEHPSDAKAFSQAVMQNMSIAEARFTAALELLKAHSKSDPEKLAAIGYCFGGGVALYMARSGAPLDAVASFHGSLGPALSLDHGETRAALLVQTGGADPFVPEAQVEAFDETLRNEGVDLELVIYPDAKHGFTNPEATALGERFDLPLAYDAAVDAESWQALTAFFDAKLD